MEFRISEVGLGNSSSEQIEPNRVDPRPLIRSHRVSEPNLDPKPITGKGKASGSKNVVYKSHRSITDLPAAMICEILDYLGPKELGIVSCVSTNFYRLVSGHHIWKEFYCERWGLDSVYPNDKSWKEVFVERDFRSKAFLGRYSIDVLYGHTEPVRAVSLLVSAKLMFTSGYDSIVRMWDLEDGLAIASSPPLGCTIRAIAVDTKLLVVGGTDGFIHGWKTVDGSPYLFNIRALRNENGQFRLWGHEGPLTSLALDMTRLYSGSWDMSVRIWDRVSLECIQVLRHSDWVWGIVPCGTTVTSSSGSDVYVWDSSCGDLVTVVRNPHVGYTYSIARSHSGAFIFTGGADGAIHMFEISASCALKVASWAPHMGPVYSLAFEFPWLVSASSDGKMSMIDVRKVVKTCEKSPKNNRASKATVIEPPQRMLHGFSCDLFSIAIGADRIVCGGEGGVVRIWNFTQALENEKRVRAMRGIRLEKRMRRRKLLSEIDNNNNKGGTGDQCLIAASKKNSIHGEKSRVLSSKLKA